ncbi:ATP-binding protein [Streptomyces sp. TRM 70351]|uniref:ATP-binding protein n=1 Tax=Streptomyces sp. TRM 70351 TaxID=3116552 RepID=UPI002E7AF5BB|nr:ATP-binding protein [Streptomyces sp. TRM 70351]MEE1930349.1 ATP-binding protein [Streptomyces sp. TRM 70351]
MGTEATTVLDPLWQSLPPLDSGALAGSASCALPPHYEAVGAAREFTRATLAGWGLERHCDNVTLAVSELVTNALRHGLRPVAGAVSGAVSGAVADPPVRLHLMRWASRLVCAVRDPSREAPVSGNPDALEFSEGTAESGRGLFLVEAFSDSWGWQPLHGTLPGKVVWALFRMPAGPA